MFQSYRTLFQSLLASSFIHGLTGTPDNDGNRTNIDELIGIIAGDKRLDGKDNLYINELLDKLASSTEISDIARQQISTQMKAQLEKSLIQGYTVLDETSYNTYVRVMKFLHPDTQLPPYTEIETTLFGVFPSTYSFVYDTENKIISLYRHDQYSSGGNVFGTIQNGKVMSKTSISDWDAFSNNNQFGLSADIIDGTIPTPEPKVEESKPEPGDIPPLPDKLPPPVFPEPKPEFVPPRWPHTPTPEPKVEEPKDKGMTSSPRPKPRPLPTPDEYTVESGDILWDIVKDHYGLTDNQAIAKRVNEVVESQTDANLLAQLRKDVYGANMRNVKDGITGDILYPGDIILLPVFESFAPSKDDSDK